MHLIEIKIQLHYEYVVDFSPLIIKFDNKILYEGLCNKKEYSFFVENTDGIHKIQLHLLRKDINETIVENGKIIKDTFIKVSSIFIDNYSMRYLVNDCGKVVVDWNKNLSAYEYMINNNITPNEIFYKLNILSFICFYEFEFEFPIAQWLIKKNNLIGYKSNIENITKLKKLAENKLKKRIDKL